MLRDELSWEKQGRNPANYMAAFNGIYFIAEILILTILDVNDNDPEFDSENYTMSVSENALDNTRLGEVHASDIDKNRTISYTINSGDYPTSSFRIGRKTGTFKTFIFLISSLSRKNVSLLLLIPHASIDRGHIIFALSFCSFVRLYVCLFAKTLILTITFER